MTRPMFEVRNVDHGYGGPRSRESLVLQGIEILASPKEFVSIVGPSGCGKSTLLRLISGLSAPRSGEVIVKGEPVTRPRSDVGFIFQRDALLPWRTVAQNVQLALKFRKVPRSEARDRALDWLQRFGLGGMGDRFPHQMSGGQRKRVAIAATLVYEPSLLLMDEPFSALDVQTRDLIEADVLRAWDRSDEQTVAFVTHDLEEAIALSDRIIVMAANPGRVKSEYTVDLPRPRDIMEIRSSPEFRRYYALIWDDLRAEVTHGAKSSPREVA